jgi:hypothetical protein
MGTIEPPPYDSRASGGPPGLRRAVTGTQRSEKRIPGETTRNTATILALLLAASLLGLPALAQQNIIARAIGGGPNDMPATDADINDPTQVAVDTTGNYYFAAYNQNRVFKVSTSGALTVVAGNGDPGYAGDGVPGGASNALLNGPWGVAVDGSGNVYIADENNCVIRKVETTNTITTIAGQAGLCGYNGTGSPATSIDLNIPAGMAADSSGTSTISEYAGTGPPAIAAMAAWRRVRSSLIAVSSANPGGAWLSCFPGGCDPHFDK